MTVIFQHRFQVVDDAASGTHAAGGDNNSRSAGFSEISHGLLMFLMAVDGIKVVEIARMAAALQTFLRFFIPVGFQLAVNLIKPGGQG